MQKQACDPSVGVFETLQTTFITAPVFVSFFEVTSHDWKLVLVSVSSLHACSRLGFWSPCGSSGAAALDTISPGRGRSGRSRGRPKGSGGGIKSGGKGRGRKSTVGSAAAMAGAIAGAAAASAAAYAAYGYSVSKGE